MSIFPICQCAHQFCFAMIAIVQLQSFHPISRTGQMNLFYLFYLSILLFIFFSTLISMNSFNQVYYACLYFAYPQLLYQQIKHISQTMQQNQPVRQNSQEVEQIKDVDNKLIAEIQQGKISILNTVKPFPIMNNIQKTNKVKDNRKALIEKLKKQKNKTMHDLNALQEKQHQLKDMIKSIHRQKIKSMEKSLFTQQQKQKIKEIMKLSKLQEQQRKQKHQKILQKFAAQLKNQEREEKQKIEKIRLQNKSQIQKNINSLEIRKKNREQFKKQSSLRMLQIKKKRYIHLIKQNEDLQQQQMQKQQTKIKLQQIREKTKINFIQIKQHKKKYQNILTEKQEQRKQKFKEIVSSRNIIKYENGYFSQLIEKEEQIRAQQQLRKENIAIQKRQKIKSFQNYVRQKFIPRLRTDVKSFSTSPSTTFRKALSHKQTIDKGKQYLTIAKKLRKQRDSPRIVTEPQIKKYMNYLKSFHRNSQPSQRFKTILNTQEDIDYHSAQKARNLIDQIQAKSKKGKDARLIESIQNKIDLLKVLV